MSSFTPLSRLALLAALCLALAPAYTAPAAAPRKTMTWEDARLLAEVLQRIRDNYVAPVDDHQLVQQAARGMVSGLDEHSGLLDRDEYQEVQRSTSGAYAGIGIEVEAQRDAIAVVRCMPASPAERAGLQVGDAIVSVDGVAVTTDGIDAALLRMRGEPDSSIRLTVARGGRTMPFVVQRARVELASVASQSLAGDIGYVRINSFTDSTEAEFANALQTLRGPARAPLHGLVIDLRNNGGGVFHAAVDVADDLLERGRIVSAAGRAPDANFFNDASPGDLSDGAELVVIVNGNSASAAEILAAALHDNQRATLLGRRTYGKGTVQSIMPLSDGRALKITTSRYYTPKGESLDRRGIIPDISVDTAEHDAAELDPVGMPPTLAARDATVGVALQTLRQRIQVAAGAGSSPARS
jgi:carboxyl-terminal processing protease